MQELQQKMAEAFSSMPVQYLMNILEIGTKHYNLDQQLLLNEAGLHDLAELKEKERMPVYYAFSFVMSILYHSKDQKVGLIIGQYLELKSFHVLGYLLMNCENLGEAIATILQFEKLALETSTTIFECENDDGKMIWYCPYEGEEARYFVEIILSGWVCHALKMTLEDPQIKEVNFMHAPPSDISAYEKAFGDCRINFNAHENSVVFPRSSLDIPFRQYDSELKKIITLQAGELLEEIKYSVSFMSCVRRNIFQLMQADKLSLEKVAEQMALSPRVLHNRLKKQGLTFNCLVDEVRQITANMVIENVEVSLVELGCILGFNDQSSFTRAFKRWHGETPGDFRRYVHVRNKTHSVLPEYQSLSA